MTARHRYSPYSSPQYRRGPNAEYWKPGRNRQNPNKNRKPRSTANQLPGKLVVSSLFLTSICLNVFNVYSRFAPETMSRFVASGIFDFIAGLPLFGFIAFVFRLGAAILTYLAFAEMRKNNLSMNPVWWMILFTAAYAAVVGLGNLLITIPFVVAMCFVIGLQYVEIIFWNAPRKTVWLWLPVIAAYIAEVWMQYEMMPFHADYSTALELTKALFGMDFNWENFMPFQVVLALIGVFGIEVGERFLSLVKKYA